MTPLTVRHEVFKFYLIYCYAAPPYCIIAKKKYVGLLYYNTFFSFSVRTEGRACFVLIISTNIVEHTYAFLSSAFNYLLFLVSVLIVKRSETKGSNSFGEEHYVVMRSKVFCKVPFLALFYCPPLPTLYFCLHHQPVLASKEQAGEDRTYKH